MSPTNGPSIESFMYLETTIPAGVTIPEYRRSRPARRHGLRRLRFRIEVRGHTIEADVANEAVKLAA